jgi:hypothetical protein
MEIIAILNFKITIATNLFILRYGGTLVTMPVKYFAPKVTVKLYIIDFSSSR